MEDNDDSTAELLESSRFWIQRILVPIVVFIGVAGNAVSVVVLTRKKMICTTTIYLTALAVADVIYLIFVLILSFDKYPNIHDGRYEFYWNFYAISHWICDAASSMSVWLTVSFTVERYIVVCHPIRGKVLCTEGRAKCIIAIVFVMCLGTTFSTLFEYQLDISSECEKICDVPPTVNLHDLNETHVQELLDVHKRLDELSPINNTPRLEDSAPQYRAPQNKASLNKMSPNKMSPNRASLNRASSNGASPNGAPQDMKTSTFCSDSGGGSERDSGGGSTEASEEEQKFGETKFGNQTVCESHLNDTASNETCCKLKYTIGTKPSSLGNNATYKRYFFWFSSLYFGLIPLILIATFNAFLVFAMFKSRRKRKRMTIKRRENNSQSHENRITLLLIAVVVLFLICQTPTASHLIYYVRNPPSDEASANIMKTCGNIFNFLINLNAAVNFVLYCVLSGRYRRTFKELFCKRKLDRQETSGITRLSTRSPTDPRRLGYRRNQSEYVRTPRNLEPQSFQPSRSNFLLPEAPRSRTASENGKTCASPRY